MSIQKANAIFKKYVTDEGKERVTSAVRIRLVLEAGHNYCSKCDKLYPVEEFAETTTNDVGYMPYCKKHSTYVSKTVPVEDYQPDKKMKPAELVDHFNAKIDEALKEGKRVPKNLKLAIEEHAGDGISYCGQCRWVHVNR